MFGKKVVGTLSKNAAIWSFIFIVPRKYVLEELDSSAPSDQLNIATIGAGGKRGQRHHGLASCQKVGAHRSALRCGLFQVRQNAAVEKFPECQATQITANILTTEN